MTMLRRIRMSPACYCSTQTKLRFFLRLFVRKKNDDHEGNSAQSGGTKEEDCESCISQNSEGCFHFHEHCCTDNQSSKDQSNRDSVRHYAYSDRRKSQ